MLELLKEGGILTVLAGLFLLFLTGLLIALPFAVFGIKDHLDRIFHQQKSTNRVLESIKRTLQEMSEVEPSKINGPTEDKPTEDEPDDTSKIATSSVVEKALKEEEKLEKSSATIFCPKCGIHIVAPDLRDGIKHPCPACGAKLVFV